MNERLLPRTELGEITTPAYVIDESALLRNLKILRNVADKAGCKILLAQKAFSMFAVYPMISEYLSGTTASGLYEAKLGCEEFGGDVHVFCPAYKDSEFDEIADTADHIVFNSFTQLRKFRSRCKGKSIGIRINPECSTQDEPIYDPCASGSRLGVTLANFDEAEFEGVDGIHFHTLCEQGFEPLETTLKAVEEKFGKYLNKCRWVNFGGGHHITKSGYDIEGLINCIKTFSEKYGVQVYLEPGEAVVLNAGWLVTEVMETVHNGMDIAILDASAACHMPDVLHHLSGLHEHIAPVIAHLPCRRHYRRLQLRRAPHRRRQAVLRGHGALHYGQKQHVQRNAAARYRNTSRERGIRACEAVRV